MNRTDRLLAIMLELQAKKWQRAEDLAETFEVSKRTIYRDMLALMESGIPLISSPGQGYALVEGYFLPPLTFTADEAVVLLLGSDYMLQNFDAQYQAAALSSGKKIRVVLGDKRRAEVDDLQQSMRFIAMNPLNEDTRPEVLRLLRTAIIQRKRLRLVYHTRHGETSGVNTRDVDPYGLAHVDKAWYLVAYCHLRHDIRHFRLERIDRLQVLGTDFTRPEDFSILPRFEDDERNLTVRIWFSATIARWVQEERPFFAVQTDEQPDGLLVTLQVREEEDVIQWLLSWGSQARVLEPASLRKRLIEEAEAMLRLYQQAESLLT